MEDLTEDAKKVYEVLCALKPVECNDLLNYYVQQHYIGDQHKFFCCALCKKLTSNGQEILKQCNKVKRSRIWTMTSRGQTQSFECKDYCPVTLCYQCTLIAQREKLVQIIQPEYPADFICLDHTYNSTLFGRLYAKLIFAKEL